MKRHLWFYCAFPLGALGLAGCHCCGSQSCYSPAPVVRSSGILPAHPLTPCQSCPVAPPVALNPPTPIPPGSSGYQPMPSGPRQQTWGAAPPNVNLGGPEPIQSDSSRESASIRPPESVEPPRAGNPEKPPPTPQLPVGIANFAPVMAGVASGLRPTVPDGVDWLVANGYKTALQIRAPGEDNAGDRNLFERRGLKYLSLEVSPKTLTPQIVADFNRIVDDPANRPLFVYDKDGSLAGGLWYLHFRTIDKLSDEQARKKAADFGLKEGPEGSQGEMWLAIQKYLADQK